MNKKRFKDQCDICLKWEYCKGYKNKVLCENCFKKEQKKPIEIVGDKDGQRRFNF